MSSSLIHSDLLDKNAPILLKIGKMLLENWHLCDIHHVKKAKDICTNLDLESEKIILTHIQKEYPNYNIISEEDGEKNNNSNYTWVIDPIDGSKNFLYHLPFFNITIALLNGDETIFGIIYSPVTQELFYANQTQGGFHVPVTDNFQLVMEKQQKLMISTENDLKCATIHSEFPTAHRTPDPEHSLKTVNKFFQNCYRLRSIGSGALALAYTAMGAYDGYIDFSRTTNIWDIAAGVLLIREAGGIVTDFNGKDIKTASTDSLIATNKNLHIQIMQTIRS